MKFTPLVTRAYALASDPTRHQSQRTEVHEKVCSCTALPPEPISLDQRIIGALAEATAPIPIAELRSKFRIRNATLYDRLNALTASGRVVKTNNGS